MKFFTVHEPDGAPADRIDRAERLVFVRDGLSWSTLVFGPFALLWRRLFLAFACWLAAAVAIVLVTAVLDADAGWVSMLMLALNAVFAFEVSEFQRAKLASQGARMLGTVSGRSRAECERRFFESWLSSQPMVTMDDGSGHDSRRPRGNFLRGLLRGRDRNPSTRGA